jgi:hypothetical protein
MMAGTDEVETEATHYSRRTPVKTYFSGSFISTLTASRTRYPAHPPIKAKRKMTAPISRYLPVFIFPSF